MHIIHTSGVHFVSELKAHLAEGDFVPDERFEAVAPMRSFVSMVHRHLLEQGEMRENPAMLVCACYHDGLLDAFDHIEANRPKGNYHHRCHTQGLIGTTYRRLLEERKEDGRWLSVAYVEGYMNGLTFLLADDEDRKKLPLYYVIGCDDGMRTYAEYDEAARYFRTLNREAYAYAKFQAERLAPGVVFQHLPSLL